MSAARRELLKNVLPPMGAPGLPGYTWWPTCPEPLPALESLPVLNHYLSSAITCPEPLPESLPVMSHYLC